jgi:hypothetical protein
MKYNDKLHQQIRINNPEWSEYVCLCMAISGRKLSRKIIRDLFLKYVVEDDYEIESFDELISHLYLVSENGLVSKQPLFYKGQKVTLSLREGFLGIDEDYITQTKIDA